MIACFFVITCFAFAEGIDPTRYHVAVSLQAKWNDFCLHIEKFRTDVSIITLINHERIKFLNVKLNCEKASNDNVTVNMYVVGTGGRPMNETLEVTATLVLRNALQDTKFIGNYKVISVETVSIDSVHFKYSAGLIGKVIAIVLSIYLLGYLLILSMKSLGARPDSSERRVSLIMASENVHFSTVDGKFLKRHSVDHVFAPTRNMKQYSVKHK